MHGLSLGAYGTTRGFPRHSLSHVNVDCVTLRSILHDGPGLHRLYFNFTEVQGFDALLGSDAGWNGL
jgi:hypothetical protein